MKRSRVERAAVIAVSAALLLAVAYWNRWPLLYSDSIPYLAEGRRVLRAFVGAATPPTWHHRSLLYSVVLWPFHLEVSPWGIALFNAIVVAALIHAILSWALPGLSQWREWAVVVGLTAGTAVAWHVALVMPDILAAVVILVMVLLGSHPRATRHGSLLLVAGLWFAIVSHTSHLALALVLIGAFAAGQIFIWKTGVRGALRALRVPLIATVVAVASQVTVNWVYNGHPSLLGTHLPHLLARVVEDGTASMYLERNCDRIDSPLCEYRDQLPQLHFVFLFEEGGVLAQLTDTELEKVSQQETAFVLATILESPGVQLRASFHGFLASLSATGVADLRSSPYVETQIHNVAIDGARHYRKTRQFQDTLPIKAAGRVQRAVRWISVLMCVGLGWVLRRRKTVQWLLWMVACGFVANSAIAGILSSPQPRYTSRIDWLLPLLAYVLAEIWWRERRKRKTGNSTPFGGDLPAPTELDPESAKALEGGSQLGQHL